MLQILFVVLVVLKATGLTALSWGWVFAPLWVPLSLCLLGALVEEYVKAQIRYIRRRRR